MTIHDVFERLPELAPIAAEVDVRRMRGQDYSVKLSLADLMFFVLFYKRVMTEPGFRPFFDTFDLTKGEDPTKRDEYVHWVAEYVKNGGDMEPAMGDLSIERSVYTAGYSARLLDTGIKYFTGDKRLQQ